MRNQIRKPTDIFHWNNTSILFIFSIPLLLLGLIMGCDKKEPEDQMVHYVKSVSDVLITYKDTPNQAKEKLEALNKEYKPVLTDLSKYVNAKLERMNPQEKQTYLNQLLANLRPAISNLTQVGQYYINEPEVQALLDETAAWVETLKN